MLYREIKPYLSFCSIWILALLVVTACTHTQNPPPDNSLRKARDELHLAKSCQHKACSEKYPELHLRFQKAQSAFYACRTNDAMVAAKQISEELKTAECIPCPPVQERPPVICDEKIITKIISNDVLFGFDQATLKPSAIAALEDIHTLMKKNVRYYARLVGHTDSTGSEAHNMRLSKRRAEAVKVFLVGKNIAPERISTEGRGAREPIAPNTTQAGRKKNRRTTITLEYKTL